MADEKGVALAILGIVAVIAVVGLVLLFAQAKTGQAARGGYLLQGDPYAGQFNTISQRTTVASELSVDPLRKGVRNEEVERWETKGGEEKVMVRVSPDRAGSFEEESARFFPPPTDEPWK